MEEGHGGGPQGGGRGGGAGGGGSAARRAFQARYGRAYSGPPGRAGVAGPIECRLCGRGFVQPKGSLLRYCGRCKSRISRDAARTKRVRCKECGGEFTTRNRSIRYCSDACRQKRYPQHRRHAWRRRPERSEEVECRICGKSFRTATLTVKYCSDACRKKGYMRNAKADGRAGRARAGPAAKCRICGKDLAPGLPGPPRVYCSDPCRAEGRRAWIREYMRRYFADPEKRAVHAVRSSEAAAARRRAKGGK